MCVHTCAPRVPVSRGSDRFTLRVCASVLPVRVESSVCLVLGARRLPLYSDALLLAARLGGIDLVLQ